MKWIGHERTDWTCDACGAQFDNFGSLGNHAKYGPCTFEQRFWGKVDKSDGTDACWLYTRRLDALGYGRVDKAGPRTFAHRVAWELTSGPVPAGMDVCHTCDVRNCCNPKHMFLGTAKDNMADMYAKGRDNSRGAKNRHAKLTEAQALEILRTKPRGQAAVALAAQLCVGVGTIEAVIARRSWKHLNVSSDIGGEGNG